MKYYFFLFFGFYLREKGSKLTTRFIYLFFRHNSARNVKHLGIEFETLSTNLQTISL